MTTKIDPETILLLGNYRPALTVARSLAAQGHRILVSLDDDAGAAGTSRAVEGQWRNTASTDPDLQYPALAQFLADRPDIRVVFPLAESYVRAFYAHRHLLPDDRIYVMPNQTAVEVCADKGRLLDLVTEAGLPVARNVTVRSYDELRKAAGTVGFPLIVKPADSTIWIGTRKVLVLEDRAAFDAALPDWPTGHAALIVQSYVDGPRLNLYFAAQHGRAIRYAAVRIGQTDLPDRTGLATDGVTIALEPRLRDIGDSLIAKLDYHGVGCIQVLRDRHTGDLSFLEINARIGGNHTITDACALELDRIAVALASGRVLDDRLIVAKDGVRYVWTTGALRGAAIALRDGEIRPTAFIAQVLQTLFLAVTTRTHITFRLTDPRPTLILLSRALPNRLRLFGSSRPESAA